MGNRRRTYGVTEAKARLSELLNRVEAGEQITVTRRGRLIAQLLPLRAARRGMDLPRLRALRAGTLKAGESAARLARRMRDERY